MRDDISRLFATMPHKEERALRHYPYSDWLQELDEMLPADEQVLLVTCAVSASMGRGILALTPTRLVFHSMKVQEKSFELSQIRDVWSRPAWPSTPAALKMAMADGSEWSFVVGAGRRWGPMFIERVQEATGIRPKTIDLTEVSEQRLPTTASG